MTFKKLLEIAEDWTTKHHGSKKCFVTNRFTGEQVEISAYLHQKYARFLLTAK